MINVLIFGLSETPSGVDSFLFNYVTNIDRSKVHFDFLCNSDKPVAYETELKAYGCKFYHVTPRNVNAALFYRKLHAFFSMKADKYDAIWVNINSLANIDYLKYAKRFGIPRRIIHSHNSMNIEAGVEGCVKGGLHEMNKLMIERYATDFFACSRNSAKWFFRSSVLDRVKIVANAIDIDKMRFNKRSRDKVRREFGIKNELLVGNIGRLTAQKNQKFVLEIFKKVLEEQTDAKLLIVGDGEDRLELKEKAKELGISDNVIFAGVRKNVSELLSAMDVFLFPSQLEEHYLALLEAQAAGLPVIASKDLISEEIKVNSNFEFISLDESTGVWADDVIWLSDVGRESWDNIKANFAFAGFDIKTQSGKLTKFFESME